MNRKWLETFWEVTAFMLERVRNSEKQNPKNGWFFGDIVSETYDDQGTPGLIDLATNWTNDFETIHKHTDFGLTGDYWDCVFEFCKYKNQDHKEQDHGTNIE